MSSLEPHSGSLDLYTYICIYIEFTRPIYIHMYIYWVREWGSVRQERFSLQTRTPRRRSRSTPAGFLSSWLDPTMANVSSVINLCEVVGSWEEPVILNVQQTTFYGVNYNWVCGPRALYFGDIYQDASSISHTVVFHTRLRFLGIPPNIFIRKIVFKIIEIIILYTENTLW